jgi:hypothetical protein
MTKAFLIILISLVLTSISQGQQCDSCKLKFDELLLIKNKAQVSSADLEKSWQISKKLDSLNYTYYDSIVNNEKYIIHSLTKTFSDICIKAQANLGVDYYLKYLDFTNGSAEEERSFALERLFVKFPEIVFVKIGQDEDLLNDLVWGFVNNRYYGAKSPFDNNDFTAMTFYEDGPKPILNQDNCKSIFFETNPTLKEKYKDYQFQIDYIINASIEILKENE